jgi:hypothetical protein
MNTSSDIYHIPEGIQPVGLFGGRKWGSGVKARKYRRRTKNPNP